MATISWGISTNAERSPTGNIITIMTGLTTAVNAGTVSASVLNDVELDMFADFEFLAGFGSNPTAGGLLRLYIVRSIDNGTSWEDGNSSEAAPAIVPANGHVGNFIVRAATSQRMIIPEISLPPHDFRIKIVNETSQALTSGTIRALCYKYKSIG